MASGRIVTLITGATSGIGLECAAQLLARGNYHVLLAARNLDKGNATLKDLQSRNLPGTASLVHLDLTKDETIFALRDQIERDYGYIDVFVSNAGIGFGDEPTLRERINACINNNATGPAVLGFALEELLKKSTYDKRRVVHVSSGAGSIGRMFDPETIRGKPSAAARLQKAAPQDDHIQKLLSNMQRMAPYMVSKAAQNLLAGLLKPSLAAAGVKTFVWNPGFTASNLGGFNTVENGARPTAAATRPLVDIIEGKRDAEESKFLSEESDSYPW